MKINKYNTEGYHDPTPFEALKSIKVYKPLVYICSPYAGDIETNINKARSYSRFAVSRGYIPLAPHLLFPQFMDDSDPEQRNLALFFGIVLLSKCQEVWVFGDRISKGMAAEIEKAEHKNRIIRYFNQNLEEVENI